MEALPRQLQFLGACGNFHHPNFIDRYNKLQETKKTRGERSSAKSKPTPMQRFAGLSEKTSYFSAIWLFARFLDNFNIVSFQSRNVPPEVRLINGRTFWIKRQLLLMALKLRTVTENKLSWWWIVKKSQSLNVSFQSVTRFGSYLKWFKIPAAPPNRIRKRHNAIDKCKERNVF